MTDRDSLTPVQQAVYDSAIQQAGKVLAAAREQRDRLFVTEGATGVARTAYTPGGPSLEALAAMYMSLREQAEREMRERGQDPRLIHEPARVF